MNMEIEYRYLLTKAKIDEIRRGVVPKIIRQSYLIKEKAFHIRVRIEHMENTPSQVKASVTTKVGKKPARQEYENELSLDHAEELFNNSISQLIKYRYEFKDEHNQTWELDFYPAQQICVAELEVPSIDYKPILPEWVVKEVTQDDKYSNTTLALPTKKSKK